MTDFPREPGRARFKCGDIVCLKGHKTRMTVEDVTGVGLAEKVSCVWFDQHDELHRESFSPSLLTITT